MTNDDIKTYFIQHSENEFRKFTSGLIPGSDRILGVRIPKIRVLAKQIAKEDFRTYLAEAKDDTYEEIMLQGLVIGYAKAEIEELLAYAERFIPKIHDWSVNDCFCATFKIARKNREKVWEFLMRYRDADSEFAQRVAAVMLMDHFLTEEYITKVFEVWDGLQHDGYYRKMGVAWGLQLRMPNFRKRHMHI